MVGGHLPSRLPSPLKSRPRCPPSGRKAPRKKHEQSSRKASGKVLSVRVCLQILGCLLDPQQSVLERTLAWNEPLCPAPARSPAPRPRRQTLYDSTSFVGAMLRWRRYGSCCCCDDHLRRSHVVVAFVQWLPLFVLYPPTPFVGVKKVDSYLARLQRQNATALASPFPPPRPQSLPLQLPLPFSIGPNPYPTPAPSQPPPQPQPPLSGRRLLIFDAAAPYPTPPHPPHPPPNSPPTLPRLPITPQQALRQPPSNRPPPTPTPPVLPATNSPLTPPHPPPPKLPPNPPPSAHGPTGRRQKNTNFARSGRPYPFPCPSCRPPTPPLPPPQPPAPTLHGPRGQFCCFSTAKWVGLDTPPAQPPAAFC